MEHFVMRLYDAGCRVDKHVRQVKRTRGHFSTSIEQLGQRIVRVARLHPATGYERIPNLYISEFLGISSSCWVLDGRERIEAGPARKECLVAQTWLVEPVYEDDLIQAENKWLEAVSEVNDLRTQLAALGDASAADTPPSP